MRSLHSLFFLPGHRGTNARMNLTRIHTRGLFVCTALSPMRYGALKGRRATTLQVLLSPVIVVEWRALRLVLVSFQLRLHRASEALVL